VTPLREMRSWASCAVIMAGLVQVQEVALVMVIGTAIEPNLHLDSDVESKLLPVMVTKVPPDVGPPRGAMAIIENVGV
jgi:hypothetical protein